MSGRGYAKRILRSRPPRLGEHTDEIIKKSEG
jgi:hypothetical protein